MATVTVGSRGFDMAALDFDGLIYAVSATGSGTTFRVSYNGGLWDRFDGNGFQYRSGVPTGGTVTGWAQGSGRSTLIAVTGINVSVRDILDAVQTYSSSDDAAVIRAALGGDDRIEGNAGADRLLGFAGAGRIAGRAGDDRLEGGDGNDVLIGGIGDDLFDFDAIGESTVARPDTIIGFERGRDRIDLSTIDADQNATGGNQAFSFIGTAAFSGVEGQLRFAGGMIQGDVNGDARADFEIELYRLTTLTAADIIL